MKYITMIFTMLILFSCTDEKLEKEQKLKKPYELTYVMENNLQCELNGGLRIKTYFENLYGTWDDTLSWVSNDNDTCWYGVRCVNRNVKFEFKSSKIFIKTVTFEDSTLNFVEKGEYFLSSDSIPATLTLAKKNGMDTLFKHGDTMATSSYKIYWPDSKRLLLIGRTPKKKKGFEILEFNKIN